MKFSFEYDRTGMLWQGLRLNRVWSFYDLGILALDWYKSERKLSSYFWRFNFNIIFGEAE